MNVLSRPHLLLHIFIMAPISFSMSSKAAAILLTLALLLLSPPATADTGTCRYDEDRCSCKIGDENQGICWDADAFAEGFCNRRFCNPGWTCACGGRTHLCFRENRQVRVISAGADPSQPQALCTSRTFLLVSARDITLGTVRIHVSEAGIRADDCTQLAWWHNGELLGSRARFGNKTNIDYAEEVKAYEDHSMIELRPGDLVAFRFEESSYYCYKSLTDLVVNTTAISSTAASVITHYSRKYSADWFLPSYKLTAANMGVDESDTVMEKFLPLRTNTLVTGANIVSGQDYWAPRDDSNSDNLQSNWYFRIQIPETL